MKALLLAGLLSVTAAQQSAAANWNGLLESHVYATHGIITAAPTHVEAIEIKSYNAVVAKDALITEAEDTPLLTLEVLKWERDCNRDLQVTASEIPGPMPLNFDEIDRKLAKRKR